MKTIFKLFALVAVLSLVAPTGIFAAERTTPLCPDHPGTACFLKGGDYYCNLSETVTKTRLTRGRAGQLDFAPAQSTGIKQVKCAMVEH